ncbi:tRNA pseudouridine(55) synthase TruB [bacterium]|nr:tRNA pseudouridine(55) synthase TruB [bacterium]
MNDMDRPATIPARKPELAGWLAIDKPAGMTSHDVLARLRKRHRKIKMGHAGTLDPLATGLLLVAIGSATRLVEATHALDKSYDARIRLGAVSSSDDADGEVTELPDAIAPDRDRVEAVLQSLTGPAMLQVPPAVSAIHVDGKRAYDLARSGAEFELKARPVRIDRIVVTDYRWPWLEITVDCGAGTYIRSIARDAGAALGCGGLIERLRRTRIGDFSVAGAVSLEAAENAESLECLLRAPVEALSGWSRVTIADPDAIKRISRGQEVRVDEVYFSGTAAASVALIDSEGFLLALAHAESLGNEVVCRPYRVFVSQ